MSSLSQPRGPVREDLAALVEQVRYDGKSFTVFRENSGLVPNYWVQSIFEDKDGTLWLACSGGVFRFNGTSFINVTRNGPWR